MQHVRDELENYVHDCLILKRELEQAIVHLRLTKVEGMHVRYAVDFSEIYAYILPGESARELRLLFAGTEAWGKFQRIVLRRLFLTTPDGLVLLRPYAKELESFLYRLASKEFQTEIERAIAVYDEVETLRTNDDFLHMVSLAAKTNLTNEDRESILEFLELQAPNLFLLAEPRWGQPLRLVHSLQQKNVFRDLNEVVKLEKEDYAVYERWRIKLTKGRGEKSAASSALDAMAVASLVQANRELRDRNEKIVLVTRSQSMHKIFEKEVLNGDWREFNNHMLLSPRTIGILNTVNHLDGMEAVTRLEWQLRPIDDFLVAITSDQEDLPLDNANHQSLEDYQEKINLNWQSTVALAVSREELNEPSTQSRDSRFVEVSTLIGLVRQDTELKQLIVTRLSELADLLERMQCGLILYIEGPLDLKRQIRAEEFDENPKYVLSSNSSAMPYTLQFYSSLAPGIIGVFEGSRTNGWRNLLNLFREVVGAESDYESYLLITYVLGALTKWRLAERYCLRALQVAGRKDSLFPHEAHFFFAVCLRKNDSAGRSVERHLQAIEELDLAIKIKRERLGKPDYLDPRYLKEKATHVLLLNLDYADVLPVGTPTSQDALDLLKEAEKRCKNDAQLMLQIANNRLYFQVERHQFEDRDSLEKDLNEVLLLQMSLEGDEKKWPPEILDTVAWADWLLHANELSIDTEKILGRLELANTNRDIPEQERKRIKQHLAAVRMSLKGQAD